METGNGIQNKAPGFSGSSRYPQPLMNTTTGNREAATDVDAAYRKSIFLDSKKESLDFILNVPSCTVFSRSIFIRARTDMIKVKAKKEKAISGKNIQAANICRSISHAIAIRGDRMNAIIRAARASRRLWKNLNTKAQRHKEKNSVLVPWW